MYLRSTTVSTIYYYSSSSCCCDYDYDYDDCDYDYDYYSSSSGCCCYYYDEVLLASTDSSTIAVSTPTPASASAYYCYFATVAAGTTTTTTTTTSTTTTPPPLLLTLLPLLPLYYHDCHYYHYHQESATTRAWSLRGVVRDFLFLISQRRSTTISPGCTMTDAEGLLSWMRRWRFMSMHASTLKVTACFPRLQQFGVQTRLKHAVQGARTTVLPPSTCNGSVTHALATAPPFSSFTWSLHEGPTQSSRSDFDSHTRTRQARLRDKVHEISTLACRT